MYGCLRERRCREGGRHFSFFPKMEKMPKSLKSRFWRFPLFWGFCQFFDIVDGVKIFKNRKIRFFDFWSQNGQSVSKPYSIHHCFFLGRRGQNEQNLLDISLRRNSGNLDQIDQEARGFWSRRPKTKPKTDQNQPAATSFSRARKKVSFGPSLGNLRANYQGKAQN